MVEVLLYFDIFFQNLLRKETKHVFEFNFSLHILDGLHLTKGNSTVIPLFYSYKL